MGAQVDLDRNEGKNWNALSSRVRMFLLEVKQSVYAYARWESLLRRITGSAR
jgi:hypothetical protein